MEPTLTQAQAGDALILGAGIAGLFAALKLAPRPVTVISGSPLGENAATAWAQGGIAAAIGADDDPAAHAADTLAAAAGLADAEAVALLTAAAPARIADLVALGVPFDREDGGALARGREAAHGRARILHVGGDRTGAGIMSALLRAVRATPSIRVLSGWVAEDLWVVEGRVVGALLRQAEMPHRRLALSAPATVLATGGIGHLYALTTSPAAARGDGLAMAARAGAVLIDLEFVQFHPTAMDVGLDPAPLATEALRGEGAWLVDETGARIMAGVHPDLELAPRDVVARAIWRQRQAGHRVFLDARDALGTAFAARFPTVYAHCRRAGIDPATAPIPVAPAAHYHMGGVATDLAGRTSVPGLWACGEVAATGVHGANRLASNSLLEGLVFAERAAADIAMQAGAGAVSLPLPPQSMRRRPIAPAQHMLRARLRRCMMERLGVMRDGPGLRAAVWELDAIAAQAEETGDLDLGNMALVGRLIAVAALRRRESRGSHFRQDHPLTRADWAERLPLTLAAADALAAEAVPAAPALAVQV